MLMLRPDEAAMFEGQPKGFPFGDFRLEDVMLPEGDDMGIASDDDDIDEETIEQETGFETVVGRCCRVEREGVVCMLGARCTHIRFSFCSTVVDGLPVVGPEKVEKLTVVLRKLFNNEKLGEVREGVCHGDSTCTDNCHGPTHGHTTPGLHRWFFPAH